MIIHTMQQGTPEWDAVRCAKFTGSPIYKLQMAIDTKGYNEYLDQLAYEIFSGEKVRDEIDSEWMQRGSSLEPEARLEYQLQTFNRVEEVGFIERDEWTGFSPDGLIGDDGLLEIKCPKYTTVMKFVKDGKVIPKKYMLQMQWGMLCSKKTWHDYFVYHPVLRVEPIKVIPDNKIQDGLELAVQIAKREIESRVQRLENDFNKQRIKQIKGDS